MLAQARECKVRLEALLSQTTSSSTPQTGYHQEPDLLLFRRTNALLPSLITLIQSTVDPEQMEELLALNDALTSLLCRSSPESAVLADGPEDLHGTPTEQGPPIHRRSSTSSNGLGLENGTIHETLLPPADVIVDSMPGQESDGEDSELFSPRIDKGKGKAMEQASPVLQKLIMSPSFSITDSDDEEEEQQHSAEEMELDEKGQPIPIPSPTDRCAFKQFSLFFIQDNYVTSLGREVGWRKRVRYFARVRCFLVQKKWRANTLVRNFGKGCVSVTQCFDEILTHRYQLLEAEVERPPARQLDREGDLFEEDILASPSEVPDLFESPRSPTSPPLHSYVPRQRSTSFDNSKT